MVEAYWISVEKCIPGKLYLVGNSNLDSVHTFREALNSLVNLSYIEGISNSIDKKYVRPTQVPYLIADVSDFENQTGWKAKIKFDVILKDTLNYWRNILTTNPDYGKFSAL